MSFENEIPFGVKASNLSSVASFASTLDDSYILVIANNCNDLVDNGNSYDFVYNDVTNAAIFGASSTVQQEAYIGVKSNDINHKIATFNSDIIHLDVDTKIKGNIYPHVASQYDIGSEINTWNNLYADDIHGNGININHVKVDNLIQGTSNKLIVNNCYNDDLTIDGGLNVKFLLINGVLFANSDDDIQSLFYSNLNAGNNCGGNVIEDGFKIKGTLEVDNILINNNLSVLNRTSNSSECIDIVNYTSNPSFNIQQIGEGDVFKIYNDYQHIFTMNNDGYIGNKEDLNYEIDITGVINATNFKGSGSELIDVNLSDKTTSHLQEGNNLYFTENRVYNILYSQKYFSSNPFIPYIDESVRQIETHFNNAEGNFVDTVDKLRDAFYNFSLDNVRQGSSNRYIINNIFNDSMIINGTLKVRNIELIDPFDRDITKIYEEGLYNTYSNAFCNYDFGAGRLTSSNVSNIVLGLISNFGLQDIHQINENVSNINNIITNTVSSFEDEITDINTNISALDVKIDNLNFNENISNITYGILNHKNYEKLIHDVEGNIMVIIEKFQEAFYNLSLDKIYQGTSNKYIIDNIYNDSMIINGTLKVQNIQLLDKYNQDITNIYETGLYNTSNAASNYNFEIGRMTTFDETNYETRINNVYELMSYEFEKERTKLSNRINSQENEIDLLKYNISILEMKLEQALVNIANIQSSSG